MEKNYKKLVEILNKNNLTRVSYEEKGKKWEVERTLTTPVTSVVDVSMPNTSSVEGVEIKSPILGTFYQASAPGKKAFVKKGDKVKKGQTLFIIEAMKVLNEIKSTENGVVTKINFNDGDLVQYDDTVMIIG